MDSMPAAQTLPIPPENEEQAGQPMMYSPVMQDALLCTAA